MARVALAVAFLVAGCGQSVQAGAMPDGTVAPSPADAATTPGDLVSPDSADLAAGQSDLADLFSSDLSTDALPACVPRRTRYDWGAALQGWNDPFATRVVSVQYGAAAGFGQNAFPAVVLGPPQGGGANLGGTDVLSLGNGGQIVLAFDDVFIADGPGPDLIVFENSTTFFKETGYLAVSEDGVKWLEFPCNPKDAGNGYPGCAGPNPVFANSMNKLDPTDPNVAGGNAFDLATVGLARARYVRIRDSGFNQYVPPTGGFDLDAIAIVHGELVDCY